MSEYQTQKAKPKPPRKHRNTKYPFGDLKIGHEFFVPDTVSTQLSSSRAHHQKRLGRKFTLTERDGGVYVKRVRLK